MRCEKKMRIRVAEREEKNGSKRVGAMGAHIKVKNNYIGEMDWRRNRRSCGVGKKLGVGEKNKYRRLLDLNG